MLPLLGVAISALITPPAWLPSLPQFGQPRTPSAAQELARLLVAGETDGAILNPLADECCAANVPFRPELLGDGKLWRAVSIVKGETPRWERNAKLLAPFVSNRAGQQYLLSGTDGGGTVKNYGEVFGRNLYFKAEGTFAPAPVTRATSRCPVDFTVAIESGGIVVFGVPFISSAISGPGYLRCRYLDASIRIFESPKDSPDRWEEAGLTVVQVRDELFDDPLVGDI